MCASAVPGTWRLPSDGRGCSGMTARIKVCLSLCAIVLPLHAQAPGAEIFEARIRPVLAAKCFACHSSKLKSPMGSLTLDTKAGTRKGGATGPVIVPGKPAESRLLQALRYSDPHLQMPPTGKLSDAVIADFEQWIAAGAVDPREEASPEGQPT